MVAKKYTGIDDIARRMGGKSYNTLITYRRNMNLPIYKEGGIWVAYEEDIAKWEEFQINGVFFEDEDRPTRRKSTVRKKKPKKEQ